MGFGNKGSDHGGPRCGKSGRGFGWGNIHNNRKNNSTNSDHVEFTPFRKGKGTKMTFDHVKEHILNWILKNYNNHLDIYKYMEEGNDDPFVNKPVCTVEIV